MSLINLPDDILKLFALKLDTKILLYLCIHKSSVLKLCDHVNFWSEKLLEHYPGYVSELVDDSHIKTLLLLDDGKYVVNKIDPGERQIFLKGNSTLGDLCANYEDCKVIYVDTKKSRIFFLNIRSINNTLVWADGWPMTTIDCTVPLYTMITPNNENLYVAMNSVTQADKS